ncbi:hypothetical protein HDU97_009740 [Phlyctochytrium planicorne]|nr:hypothetical protein HDU97_009740 [Phlyctochytrium planicorne]
METEAFEIGIVKWINTFPSLSRKCGSLEDCSDGGIFYEILTDIDPQWFKFGRSIDTGDNWVLKFNNLKKLYKLLTSFYEEVLGQNTSFLDVPNLTAIAKDASKPELFKLSQLIIALAVQCENNQKYILKIQSLDETSQHALMLAIEQIMGRLSSTSKPSPNPLSPGPLSPLNDAAKDTLEAENRSLRDELRQLRLKFDDLVNEKSDLQNGMQDMEQSLSNLSGMGKVDFMLKSEIENLKGELERSETRRLETETLSDKQAQIIKDLSKKNEEAAKKVEEAQRLKDQLDELRHVADKLQKAEAMIEKYKKKMEETADFRRQIKVFESQNQQLTERNSHLEEEYKKISATKPLMETYKQQITAMEGKNSLLHVENSKLEFELKEMKSKVERLEVHRRNDQDLIQSLEEQVRDLEVPHDTVGGGIPLSAEGIDSFNSYRLRIKELEQQLEKYKNAEMEDSVKQLQSLESSLQEATKLKEKFEKDYMAAIQRTLALENEMKQLRSISASDGQAERESLESRLNDSLQELAATKRRLAETEANVAQGTSVGGGGGSGVDVEKWKRQIDSYEKESRLHNAQINKLLKEKDILESTCMELKDSILQHERTSSDLKAALAALESKGQSADETTQKLATATQKIVQLTEQNSKLHGALQGAKKHILSQDKQLKEHKAVAPKDNFAEAIASYESMSRDKEEEIEMLRKELNDTRRAAKREQELMVSAWYDTILAQSRRNPQRSDVSPSSWLAQQRKQMSFVRR